MLLQNRVSAPKIPHALQFARWTASKKDEGTFDEATQLYIDPDTCIDCGLCVDECPVKAIFPEDDVPAEWKKYIEINAQHYKA
jgi:NAD-dependent dihydropyrimidine dehydrogenase PreA subunit